MNQIKNTSHFPPLVVLSGWAMPASILIGLKKIWPGEVLLFDLPGVGQAKNTLLEPQLNVYAEYFLSRAPKQAIWLGWSLGGLIAQYIALEYPQRVIALINVASTPKFMQEGEEWSGLTVQAVEQMAVDLTGDLKATLRRFLTLQFHCVDMPLTALWTRLERWMALEEWVDLKAIGHGLTLLQYSDLRTQLARLSMPTLFIYGRKDAIIPVAQAQQLKCYASKLNIEILKPASHLPLLTHQDACEEIIKKFVTDSVLG